MLLPDWLRWPGLRLDWQALSKESWTSQRWCKLDSAILGGASVHPAIGWGGGGGYYYELRVKNSPKDTRKLPQLVPVALEPPLAPF